jgi:MFS family permease
MSFAPPQNEATRGQPERRWRGMPVGVWAMGFASLFMDMSSELIHSLLPVFMVSVLGVSMLTVGVVEGVAEATAAITKVFSGALSDHMRRRKGLMVIGYAMAALTKPMFPLAGSINWVFAARFLDRIGKGIRGAPRDALIADIVPTGARGAAYGLRQGLDSIGAVLGPVLAVVLMLLLANDIRLVMWVAVVPAVVCVVLLVAYVREPEREASHSSSKALTFAAVRRLPLRYWLIVTLGAVFTLARFSEAFLVLRAQDVGLTIAYVPLVLIMMNVFFALGAYPAGAAADRMGHRTLLLLGLVVLIAANGALAMATSPLGAFVGAALWGTHMALTQGLLSKLVADNAPAPLLGTAFGIFNLVSGTALLIASVVAGALWSFIGPVATFIAGASFAAAATVGLVATTRRRG